MSFYHESRFFRAGMDLEPGWPCNGPLLRLAEDVARRLLPAFDTKTGMQFVWFWQEYNFFCHKKKLLYGKLLYWSIKVNFYNEGCI